MAIIPFNVKDPVLLEDVAFGYSNGSNPPSQEKRMPDNTTGPSAANNPPAAPPVPFPAPALVVVRGNQTSEYAITKWVLLASFAVTLLGAALQFLQSMSWGPTQPSWVAPTIMALGLVIGALKAWVYTSGRANVKIAAYDAQTSANDLAAKAAGGFALLHMVIALTVICSLLLPMFARADNPPTVIASSQPPLTVGRVTWLYGETMTTGVWMTDAAQMKLDADLRQCGADRDAATLKAAQGAVPAWWYYAGGAVLAGAAFGLGYRLAK